MKSIDNAFDEERIQHAIQKVPGVVHVEMPFNSNLFHEYTCKDGSVVKTFRSFDSGRINTEICLAGYKAWSRQIHTASIGDHTHFLTLVYREQDGTPKEVGWTRIQEGMRYAADFTEETRISDEQALPVYGFHTKTVMKCLQELGVRV